MKACAIAVILLLVSCVPTLLAQSTGSTPSKTLHPTGAHNGTIAISSLFRSNRLKQLKLGKTFIAGDNLIRMTDGMWESQSSDPAKALVFPQQAKIDCYSYEKTCHVITVTIMPSRIGVAIQDIDEQDFQISSWDANGLFAVTEPSSTDCQRSVLSMSFRSGAVSLSDIPTHNNGCKMFNETNSYRLVSGHYYVDTTPGNDSDKPNRK